MPRVSKLSRRRPAPPSEKKKNPFPFLKTPSLAQDVILKNMDLLALLKFSNLSIRSKNILKTAKVHLHEVAFKTDDDGNSLLITLVENGETLCFGCQKNSIMARKARGDEPTLEVAGMTMKRQLNGEYWKAGCMTNSQFEDLVSYFLDTFVVLKSDLIIESPTSTEDDFVWQNMDTNWNRIVIKLRRHEHYNAPLFLDDAKFILDKTTTDTLCHLDVNVWQDKDNKLMYTEGLKNHPFLRISNPDWLSLDAVLNSDCVSIWLDGWHPTDAVFRQILDTWLSGKGLKNLLHFKVVFDWGARGCPRVKNTMLEGLELFEWDSDERPRHFRYKSAKLCLEDHYGETCGDIEKEDGTLASVIRTSEIFGFCAWTPETIEESKRREDEVDEPDGDKDPDEDSFMEEEEEEEQDEEEEDDC